MGRLRQLRRRDARQRQEFRRLAIAQGDGAGLVEQQGIDVARRLDGAARHGQHVELDQPVHAGDADGREQRADGGGNQGHEQRHQDDDRHGAAGIAGEARDGDRGEDEDDRHAGQEHVEGDLVGRLLAHRPFHQRDHPVEEGRAGGGGDADLDPIRQHPRAAGDRRAVAAALADDGRGFAGDGGFIDRGHAFDHIAVAGDHVPRLDQHQIALLEIEGGDHLELPRGRSGAGEALGLGLGAGPAQILGLGLAPPLGHRLGEIGEDHGEPEPEDDLGGEADPAMAGEDVPDQDDGGQRRDDLDHEHHGVAGECPRVELAQGFPGRAQQDLRGDPGDDALAGGQRGQGGRARGLIGHDLPQYSEPACICRCSTKGPSTSAGK